MRFHYFIAALLLLGIIILSGCATSGTGKVIPHTILAQGSYSPLLQEKQVVFRTQGEFETFWNQYQSQFLAEGLPPINFDKETVLLLAMGQKNTGGYSITVDRVTLAGTKFQVHYTNVSPSPTSAQDQVLTQPFVLFKVQKKMIPSNVQFVSNSITTAPSPPTDTFNWMAYRPVQAQTNPWQTMNIQFVNAPTELELAQAWMASLNVRVEMVAFAPHDEATCAALNCPRGDYLYVKASNAASKQILESNGFFVPQDPFVISTKENISLLELWNETNYTILFVNPSNETLFYGGCNAFTPRIFESAGERTPTPINTCVWEGIPSQLAPQNEMPFTGNISVGGTYDYSIEYGTQCESNQPLSQANCSKIETIYSNSLHFDFPINPLLTGLIQMEYSIAQCNTNPWQVGEYAITDDTDDLKFRRWLNDNAIQVNAITFVPAPNGFAACEACNCSTGAKYRITLNGSNAIAASARGFISLDSTLPEVELHAYDTLIWLVYNPYQCFSNKWPVPKQVVKSIETDMQSMRTWAEGKGIQIQELALIRGLSTLNVECFKRTNDIYAIGVPSEDDATLARESGFVLASDSQVERFTDTFSEEPLLLMYKSKFCALPPWKEPLLAAGEEVSTITAAQQWFAEKGIPFTSISIHTTGISTSESCDTDSGMGVLVEVPAWAKWHVSPYGFNPISASYDANKTRIYPASIAE